MKKIFIVLAIASLCLFVGFPCLIHNVLIAWELSMLSAIIFFISMGFIYNNNPLGALVDSRNKVSLSIFQVILWTIIILSSIVTVTMYNIRLFPDRAINEDLIPAIPNELLVLMGISFFSFIGSPIIKNKKAQYDENKIQNKDTKINNIKSQKNITTNFKINEGLLLRNENITQASFSDIFQGEEVDNGTQQDIGKTQMLLITAIAASIYIVLTVQLLKTAGTNNNLVESLPALSDNLLFIIGISHAGYLTHKAAPSS